MVPSMGGMPKTIELFRRALDAGVVSFTQGELLDREGSAVHGAEHVRIADDWRGAAYSWAPRSARCRADDVAANARLVSCHTLFRYHVHWVRKIVRARGLPYWVVPHGCLDPYVFSYRSSQKRLWMRMVGLRHLREASAVVFSTTREMEKAARFLGRNNGRVILWPITTSAPGADVRAEARRQWRDRLGARMDERLLLFLGRLHSMKRPLETIGAFLDASPRRTRLVVAGPPEDVSGADIDRRSQGDQRVHAIGAVWGAERDSLLAACDGFISLSARENFGHAAGEALATGLPVILSPGNDLARELGAVDCGWLLKGDSMNDATQAIAEFDSATGETLETKGRAGQKFAQSKLSFERFSSELRQLALECIG